MDRVEQRAELENDLDPAEEFDLEGGERLEPNPLVSIELSVSITGLQLRMLELIARQRGIGTVEAAERLIEEGLERRLVERGISGSHRTSEHRTFISYLAERISRRLR